MKRRVLLIEDEPGLVLTLTDRLAAEGYAVESARDGDAGLEMALARSYDLILLDVMLPGRDGFDVCRELRRAGRATPVLMLTARGLLTDKVVGLKLGADDYLTKPFETAELLARMEALLRRAAGAAAGGGLGAGDPSSGPGPGGPSGSGGDLASAAFGDIRVDFRSAELTRMGRPVELSAKEFALLRCFVENRGVVLSRDELLGRVWGYDPAPTTRTVDVHVAGLRQKLEADPKRPRLIVTVHGMGYKFVG